MTIRTLAKRMRERLGPKSLGRWLIMKGASLMYPASPVEAYAAARFGMCSCLPADIDEHMETLRNYAAECGSVAELGVRNVVSTWAFICGLMTSSALRKRLICLDIEPILQARHLQKVCRAAKIELTVIQADSATAEIGDVDLLFIDTWHIEGHLKRELAKHSSHVTKYIIMHDTTTDGEQSESTRSGADIESLSRKTGYSTQEIRRGLMFAVRDFIEKNKEWRIAEQFHNNNGLLVLARKQ